jgi:CheY-like chemotaxis protein
MAHILVADIHPGIPRVVAAVLEQEGHWVTCASNLWELLSAVRGTLHSMVVMFNEVMTRCAPDDDTDIDALTLLLGAEADLRRHKLLELSARGDDPHPPEVQALYDRIGVQSLQLPFDEDTLIERVARLAEELEATA